MSDLKDTPVDADRVITVLGNRLAVLVGRAHADDIVRGAQLEVLAATLIAKQQSPGGPVPDDPGVAAS